jgi:hypothetical protein
MYKISSGPYKNEIFVIPAICNQYSSGGKKNNWHLAVLMFKTCPASTFVLFMVLFVGLCPCAPHCDMTSHAQTLHAKKHLNNN